MRKNIARYEKLSAELNESPKEKRHLLDEIQELSSKIVQYKKRNNK